MPLRGVNEVQRRCRRWHPGLRRLGLATIVALVVLPGCGGPSAAERETAERLTAVKNAFEVASSPDELESATADAFALCEQAPGTAIADEAYEAAEGAFLRATWDMDPQDLFEDGRPEIGAGYSRDFGEETWSAAAAIGFAQAAPDPYREAAFANAHSMLETIAAEWSRRSLDVATDRVAWARELKRTGSAGGYDNFRDADTYEIAYQRRLLALVPDADSLANAYARLAGTVLYAIKSAPKSSRVSANSDSITSYYTSAEIERAQTNARALLSRAKAAQAQIDRVMSE